MEKIADVHPLQREQLPVPMARHIPSQLRREQFTTCVLKPLSCHVICHMYVYRSNSLAFHNKQWLETYVDHGAQNAVPLSKCGVTGFIPGTYGSLAGCKSKQNDRELPIKAPF